MTYVVMVPGTDNKPGDGIERHVYEISKRLGRKGYKVIGVRPSKDRSIHARFVDDSYVLAMMPVASLGSVVDHLSRIKSIELLSKYNSFRKAVGEIAKTLNGPVIVHTHGFYIVSRIGRGRKCKTVSTFHGSVPLDMMTKNRSHMKAAILNGLLKKVYKNADRYTAISERIRSTAAKLYGIDENNITLTPHGVDSSFFSKSVSSSEIDEIESKLNLDRPYKILFLGQLDAGKRPDILVKAFKILCSRRKDVQLVIRSSWGDSYFETLALIERLHLGNAIRIVNSPVYGSELRALYKTSCAFVNIAEFLSGPSTALLEAMACGIPPIVYKHSSYADIVGQSNGLLLDNLDPANLADAMETLVENRMLARDLGRNAMQKMSREYDWDNVVVPRYASVYASLTGS